MPMPLESFQSGIHQMGGKLPNIEIVREEGRHGKGQENNSHDLYSY